MKKSSFEENIARLEEIIMRLEGEDVSLDESMKLFEEGVKLSRLCSDKLSSAEKKVEILFKDGAGKITKEPFPPPDNNNQA